MYNYCSVIPAPPPVRHSCEGRNPAEIIAIVILSRQAKNPGVGEKGKPRDSSLSLGMTLRVTDHELRHLTTITPAMRKMSGITPPALAALAGAI